MRTPQVVLLPLYLELYEKPFPELKAKQAAFAEKVAGALREAGLGVTIAEVSMREAQVVAAVQQAERSGADAIVTLHLSYSPSGESVGPLSRTPLPVIMFNTTPGSFGQDAGRDELLENHGIHGVQDLANALARWGKTPRIVTGQISSRVDVAEVVAWGRAAAAAHTLRTLRVGLTGEQFRGMLDFQVPFDELRASIGLEVVPLPLAEIEAACQEISEADIHEQLESDGETCELLLEPDVHRDSVRTYLALKKLVQEKRLGAYTQNFLAFAESQTAVVPFYGVSRLMQEGIGYAGEGDVLTAALVAALNQVAPKVEFTEMFCPDFIERNVFMSHMGECNPAMAAENEEVGIAYQKFAFGRKDAAVFRFRHQPGEATVVDLAPAPGGKFRIIVSVVEILDLEPNAKISNPQFRMQPRLPLEDFLTAYSENGGTHHLAIIQGDVLEEVAKLAALMQFEFVEV